MRDRCRNCQTPLFRPDWTRMWCTDCVRAFAKGLVAAVGMAVGAHWGVWWFR